MDPPFEDGGCGRGCYRMPVRAERSMQLKRSNDGAREAAEGGGDGDDSGRTLLFYVINDAARMARRNCQLPDDDDFGGDSSF